MSRLERRTKALSEKLAGRLGWASTFGRDQLGFGQVRRTDEDMVGEFQKDPAAAIGAIREGHGVEAAAEYLKEMDGLMNRRGLTMPVMREPDPEPELEPELELTSG
jgi:hypothetical protein